MKRISTVFCIAFVSIIISSSIAYTQEQSWPVQQKIDLSSGFGDFRDGRFHSGIDIRTGGRIGRRLISPVDGYLYRAKMSYTGSGKALYVKGDDGYIYVFYHLNSLADQIDKAVKREQLTTERYYIDKYFPKDSIRFSKGEMLGFTGQTGTGAPHLHFEKRTSDNRPLNPLNHGFNLKDTIRPTVLRVGFELVDSFSLFGDLSRKLFRDLENQGAGTYTIEGVPYFNSPFGLLVDGFDQMRSKGMKQAVYSWLVTLDGKEIYRTSFDSLDFGTDRAVYDEYDYPSVADGEKRVRRLFLPKGDRFAGSHSKNRAGGVIGSEDELSLGIHKVQIIAGDCNGNRSTVEFSFVWGPSDDVYSLDSMRTREEVIHEFFFTPIKGYEALEIDSLLVLTNPKNNWLPLLDAEIRNLNKGKVVVTIRSKGLKSKLLMLGVRTKSGVLITGNPFNGLVNKGGKKMDMKTIPVEGGLIVTLGTNAKVGSYLRLDLYYQDELLGREYPKQFFTKRLYGLFIPTNPKYRMVDEIDASWTLDTTLPIWSTFPVSLAVVGYEEDQHVTFDSIFSLTVDRSSLRRPTWLSITKTELPTQRSLGLRSDVYSILPKAIVTEAPFNVSCRIRAINKNNIYSGIGWRDEKEEKWVWLDDSRFEDKIASATTQGGGIFVALIDLSPPEVEFLNLVPGRTVLSNMPVIELKIIDTLSDIRNDLSIDIRIDKKWLIPEYDPESGICKAQPLEPLEPGDHHLGVIVTDKAGQKAEKYLIFNVPAKR